METGIEPISAEEETRMENNLLGYGILLWGLIGAAVVLLALALLSRRKIPQKKDGPDTSSLWYGIHKLCRGLLLLPLIAAGALAAAFVRTGGQPQGNAVHLGIMLGYCALCFVIIGSALLIWRPWYIARRAAREAAADNQRFTVRPGWAIAGTCLICGSIWIILIVVVVVMFYPGQLDQVWPIYLVGLGHYLGGALSLLLPVMHVEGEDCRYRGWNLRQHRFSLSDVALCELTCQSEQVCGSIRLKGRLRGRTPSSAALPILQQRDLSKAGIGCVLSGITVTLYDGEGNRLCRFYGNARHLPLLLKRLENRCRFSRPFCILLGEREDDL